MKNSKKIISNNTISYGNSNDIRLKNNNQSKYNPNQSYSSGTKMNKININSNYQSNEEEYITNLQKQIYYIELEMKVMKDREIETKNKIGGYEILFRDGVPLNEHFLALKTKYTNEKDGFNNKINILENDISQLEQENKYFLTESKNVEILYNNMLNQKDPQNLKNKIKEIYQKIINEKNLISLNLNEKEIISKYNFNINSQNSHIQRIIEKNNLFKEDKDKNKEIIEQKFIDKFNEIDKLVERNSNELSCLIRKFEIKSKAKIIEDENSQMIFELNKIDREVHLTKSKINELENIRELNLKYVKDEAINKKIHQKENEKLNYELENLNKQNEENLKMKVKENEEKELIIIKNKIKNNEYKMNVFLTKFKESEKEARNQLEEKNMLQIQLSHLIEESDNSKIKRDQQKREIIEINNEIDEYNEGIKENNIKIKEIEENNEYLEFENERLEKELNENQFKLDEILQKIELNNILKDVDITELKMLTQNNTMINQNINHLMMKWDKVYNKLQKIENLNLNNNK